MMRTALIAVTYETDDAAELADEKPTVTRNVYFERDNLLDIRVAMVVEHVVSVSVVSDSAGAPGDTYETS